MQTKHKHIWEVSDIPDWGESRTRYTCEICGTEFMEFNPPEESDD